jgi:hypothetical protein
MFLSKQILLMVWRKQLAWWKSFYYQLKRGGMSTREHN